MVEGVLGRNAVAGVEAQHFLLTTARHSTSAPTPSRQSNVIEQPMCCSPQESRWRVRSHPPAPAPLVLGSAAASWGTHASRAAWTRPATRPRWECPGAWGHRRREPAVIRGALGALCSCPPGVRRSLEDVQKLLQLGVPGEEGLLAGHLGCNQWRVDSWHECPALASSKSDHTFRGRAASPKMHPTDHMSTGVE